VKKNPPFLAFKCLELYVWFVCSLRVSHFWNSSILYSQPPHGSPTLFWGKNIQRIKVFRITLLPAIKAFHYRQRVAPVMDMYLRCNKWSAVVHPTYEYLSLSCSPECYGFDLTFEMYLCPDWVEQSVHWTTAIYLLTSHFHVAKFSVHVSRNLS